MPQKQTPEHKKIKQEVEAKYNIEIKKVTRLKYKSPNKEPKISWRDKIKNELLKLSNDLHTTPDKINIYNRYSSTEGEMFFNSEELDIIKIITSRFPKIK
jgi:ribosomal protein L23